MIFQGQPQLYFYTKKPEPKFWLSVIPYSYFPVLLCNYLSHLLKIALLLSGVHISLYLLERKTTTEYRICLLIVALLRTSTMPPIIYVARMITLILLSCNSFLHILFSATLHKFYITAILQRSLPFPMLIAAI